MWKVVMINFSELGHGVRMYRVLHGLPASASGESESSLFVFVEFRACGIYRGRFKGVSEYKVHGLVHECKVM